MSNSKRWPNAWKVYFDCVRKWPIKKARTGKDGLMEYPIHLGIQIIYI